MIFITETCSVSCSISNKEKFTLYIAYMYFSLAFMPVFLRGTRPPSENFCFESVDLLTWPTELEIGRYIN